MFCQPQWALAIFTALKRIRPRVRPTAIHFGTLPAVIPASRSPEATGNMGRIAGLWPLQTQWLPVNILWFPLCSRITLFAQWGSSHTGVFFPVFQLSGLATECTDGKKAGPAASGTNMANGTLAIGTRGRTTRGRLIARVLLCAEPREQRANPH